MPQGQIISVDPGEIVTPGGVGGGGGGASRLTGDDYLATLSPQAADLIRGLAEGRQKFPTGRVLQTPFWRNAMFGVLQYDPDMDEGKALARFNARKKWEDPTATNAGAKIQALSQATKHLGQAYTEGEQLNNFLPQGVNSLINSLEKQFGVLRSGKIRAYEQTINNQVAPELTKTYRGGVGSEGDVKHWREAFGSDIPDQDRRDTFQAAAEGMGAALDTIREQILAELGPKAGAEVLGKIMTPETEAILNGIRSGKGPGRPTAAAPAKNPFR
jgi:hypothetical protein